MSDFFLFLFLLATQLYRTLLIDHIERKYILIDNYHLTDRGQPSP